MTVGHFRYSFYQTAITCPLKKLAGFFVSGIWFVKVWFGMSWIVVRKADGVAVAELFTKKSADKIDRQIYEVKTALDYLNSVNAALKSNAAKT